MEILWEFSKKIGIFWHICGKNIEKIGLGKLKINRKSFFVYYVLLYSKFFFSQFSVSFSLLSNILL